MSLKEVAIIGGTGAQGFPIVTALSATGRYQVRVLTRSASSSQAQELAALQNVTLVEGDQLDERAIHQLFNGVHAVFVNTNGSAIGEKNETFFGMRFYEIARSEKVEHFIYAAVDYCLKKSGWDEKCHWGNDAKGRVGEFVLAQGQEGMKSTVFCTGPYIHMLFDGLFVPRIEEDGTRVWLNPGGDGKIPLIALEDLGAYFVWILDHPEQSAGMKLEIAADECSIKDIVDAFIRVTGLKAREQKVDYEEYASVREPWPDAPSTWHAGREAPRDPHLLSWRQNFRGFWNYWSNGHGATRDFALLDKIHPSRISSIDQWMKKVDYQGISKMVLKASNVDNKGYRKQSIDK